MEDHNLACRVLHSLGITVLRRTGRRQYSLYGNPSPFYEQLFPSKGGKPCNTPWKHSPMLEFFLDDAEAFFESGDTGSIASGVWQEDGKTSKDEALIAMATCFDKDEVIVIRLLQEDYSERAGILRKAREQLLEKRELKQNLEVFREKSRFDGLTKIFNKSTFWELLSDEIRRSENLDYPLSILILDIDDFKKVNDTYGHLTGDMVLQALGIHVQQSLRRNDIVARYGGEEFVVLIPHEADDQAEMVGEKVRKAVETMSRSDIPPITVSVGCATHKRGEIPEDFVKRADEALYEAKSTGKNRVCVR